MTILCERGERERTDDDGSVFLMLGSVFQLLLNSTRCLSRARETKGGVRRS